MIEIEILRLYDIIVYKIVAGFQSRHFKARSKAVMFLEEAF